MHVAPNPAIAEDSRLIRQEVDRCSGILRRMSLAGAEPVGEALQDVTVEDLLDSVGSAFPARSGVVIDAGVPARTPHLRVPRHAVEQALIVLIKNAIEASQPGQPVILSAAAKPAQVRFEVTDSGAGIPA